MNLNELFETQKKLDAGIVERKVLEGQDLLPEKILALLTELGELSNEWRGFKFWKEDKEPRIHATEHDFFSDEVIREWNPLLEEYVDCLHFILSIGLELGFERINFKASRDEYLSHRIDFKAESVTLQFNNVFRFVVEFDEEPLSDEFVSVVLSFVVLGELLGFTWDQIETAYYDKNKINHERQNTNY